MTERDVTIVAAVEAGASITAVGKAHGITRQRVSQILHAHGVRFPHSRMAPGPHGTPSRYRGGCRCGACRAAETERHRRYRESAKEKEPPVHDDNGYHYYACRCPVCRGAHRRLHMKRP